MSISRMEKLTVVLPKENAGALLRHLMKLRAVSLQPLEEEQQAWGLSGSLADPAELDALRERLARIEQVLPELARRTKRRRSLFAAPHAVSPTAFRGDGREAEAIKVVDEVLRILDARRALRAALAAEDLRQKALAPYARYLTPLNFKGTATTTHFLGLLPPGVRAERADEALEPFAAQISVIGEDSAGTYVSVLVYKADLDAALRALCALGFNRAQPEEVSKNAVQVIQDIKREQQRLTEADERLEAQLCVLADKLDDVEILFDLARTALMAAEHKQSLAATERCAVLAGWCPAREHERVARLLERHGAAYEFSEPEEGDDVPILLKNDPFSRNFEWVLGMYAYPKYGKFDPTLVMSIFYFLIFGLMFADVGYGLLLILGCFGIVRWFRPREGMKRFLMMFGYCGISCALFGVLFGSYFGNFPLAFLENVLHVPVNQMPNLALLPTAQANIAVLFDPLQSPMAFLAVSLGMGALHLVAGMGVQGYLLCRAGKPLDALFDIVSYWVLFAGIGVLFLQKTAGVILTVAGVAAILLTQGRHKKGIPMKLAGGLLGLYNLISYASDLLSYCRVLALGLAAGVIAQVVNVLATLKGASFVGFLMMVVIFLVGHVLNLVINVLGTFVHTSRLQYIEFLGKFYEDGGTPFRPIVASDRYAEDTSAEDELPIE